MDNLTHSLVGAVLGQMGLKKKTGLAMPTLIIAADLPDIDATCAIYGIEIALDAARGHARADRADPVADPAVGIDDRVRSLAGAAW